MTPLIRAAYRATGASNQPQRRGRPVVVPNSRTGGAQRVALVVEAARSGTGPSPTRVVYALTTAITRLMRVGGMPLPVHAPPAVALEDVTNG